MKYSLIFVAVLCAGVTWAQQNATVKISGIAPSYVGKKLEFKEIVDYFSLEEALLATAEVKGDSTFSVDFQIEETQKIRVRAGNNRSFMYIQPGGQYKIYMPEKDPYVPFRPAGNEVELTFFDLDSTDINYEILLFNRWLDDFTANNFNYRRVNPIGFVKLLDTFKITVQNHYIADTGKYIYDYVRFTMATLDDIQHLAERNRYEKHDFYLKYSPVKYRNDAYMEYLTNFYRDMMPRLAMETNNRVYTAVLKSSPTEVMKALSKEYTLNYNRRIRELVMIQTLSEMYFKKDYPQTNIITILDSVANNALFEKNETIAKNMLKRLTQVNAGGKAPDFIVTSEAGEMKSLSNFKNKHLYIHFYDPNSDKNKIEVPLLINLYTKYLKEVNFITVFKKCELDANAKQTLDEIPWEVFAVEADNSIFKNYQIATFPNYVFLDGFGYVVAAPALGPQPNGNYETIERTFFQLEKINKQMRGED